MCELSFQSEPSALLAQFAYDKTQTGHAQVIHHSHLPEWEVMTGDGPVALRAPRVRDRGQHAENVLLTSSFLPPYLRRAKSVEETGPCRSP